MLQMSKTTDEGQVCYLKQVMNEENGEEELLGDQLSLSLRGEWRHSTWEWSWAWSRSLGVQRSQLANDRRVKFNPFVIKAKTWTIMILPVHFCS